MQQLKTLATIQEALVYIGSFIQHAVQEAQHTPQSPTDALFGLVISPEEAQQKLQGLPFESHWENGNRPTLYECDLTLVDDPLVRLVNAYSLTALDLNILLLAIAPQVDRRYERTYAYLQDDVYQRQPTVNLMLNLLAADSSERLFVWERLQPDTPLRRFKLLNTKPDANIPVSTFLTHQLYADARIIAHLFGGNTPDQRLGDAVQMVTPDDALQRNFEPHTRVTDTDIVYIVGKSGLGQTQSALACCDQLSRSLLHINLTKLQKLDLSLEEAFLLALREGYLNDSALIFTDWDAVIDGENPLSDRIWSMISTYPAAVFICGERTWEAPNTDRTRPMLRWQFGLPTFDERYALWQRALATQATTLTDAELQSIVGKYRFTPLQIRRAVLTASDLAATSNRDLDVNMLYAGAQAHSTLKLDRLARQIQPRHRWNDLVLPDDQMAQLQEMRSRAEHVHLVQDIWGFGKKIAPQPGISALFAGESGTGKTMSAEVIANDLGLLLYKIDLSAVVSKYIGETEKNLGVIFEEAQASNAILFFDEADALFGKRSEVKDARDRYANIETAYLLQQIEAYDGVAILATNLRQNLDEAFTRRLDFVITYPFPDETARYHIWQRHFPVDVPMAGDVNLERIADDFPLAGGNIRNAALASAYLAAADGEIITHHHIMTAIRREHQKMGRLTMGDF